MLYSEEGERRMNKHLIAFQTCEADSDIRFELKQFLRSPLPERF